MHIASSPGNHRANGAAEAAVKTAKRLFKKCKDVNEDPYLGLLNLRNTPTEGSDTSPCQKLYGRRTRTTLPASNQKLMTSLALKSKQQKQDYMASKVIKMNEDRHELSVLKPRKPVRLQPIDGSTTWKEGIVTEGLINRTCEVQAKGKTYRRNRGFIRPVKKAAHDLPQEPEKQRVFVPGSAPRGHGAESVVKEAEKPVEQTDQKSTSHSSQSPGTPRSIPRVSSSPPPTTPNSPTLITPRSPPPSTTKEIQDTVLFPLMLPQVEEES